MTIFTLQNQQITSVTGQGVCFTVELLDTRKIPFRFQTDSPVCVSCVAIPLTRIETMAAGDRSLTEAAGLDSRDPTDPNRSVGIREYLCPRCSKSHTYMIPRHLEGPSEFEY